MVYIRRSNIPTSVIKEYADHITHPKHHQLIPSLPDKPDECFGCAVADILTRLANERDDLTRALQHPTQHPTNKE